jgi:hypothetical protein
VILSMSIRSVEQRAPEHRLWARSRRTAAGGWPTDLERLVEGAQIYGWPGRIRRRRAGLSGPEAFELLGSFDRLQPVMTKWRVQLRCGWGEFRIGEVPNCNHHDWPTLKNPEDC